MVHPWEPGTQYNLGDVVSYHGHNYKIIQAHRSQGDWTPDRTPALWGRMQDGDDGHHGGHHEQHHEQNKQQQQQYQQQYEQHQSTYGSDQTVEIHEHEKEKHWYDLDDKRKKELEVGGGLALGLAALGGGYLAYKHHEKNEEEKKAEVWGLSNWLRDAEARRAQGPVQGGRVDWRLARQGEIPPGAIVGGKDGDGAELWVARAFLEGGVHPGKALKKSRKGAVVSYGGHELDVDQYEVLCGDSNAVEWRAWRGPLNVNSLGARPVDGGRDSDGSTLYVARAPHHDGTHPGKCSEKLKGCNIPWGGKEVLVETYEVLVYRY